MTTRRAHAWTLVFSLGWTVVSACDPLDACDPDQYYRFGSCRPCPDDSVSTGEWCICADPDMEFRDSECMYIEGREPREDAAVDGGAGDEDGGSSDTPSAREACAPYCGFLKACIADNDLAASLVQDVIEEAGIDGDASGCEASCIEDGAESANAAALDCFTSMAESTSCSEDDTFAGVEEALAVIDACCALHASSQVCTRLCDAVAVNDTALGLLPACQ